MNEAVVAAGEQRFAYHQSVAPMMWVLVALCSIELLVVHVLVAFWSRIAAGLISIVTIASILWLVGMIRSFRRLPVLLDADRLLMRTGRLRGITIPVSVIAGLRPSWSAASLKQPDMLNLAMVAYPNIVVELATPVRYGRKHVVAVAHRLDDAGAFTAALRAMLDRRNSNVNR